MALNIKNAEAEELARQLAAATGESVTRAVSVALQERLDRVRSRDRAASAARAARIAAIAEDATGRWAEPYRSTDHSELLYDEAGLPR
ncbi:type II toxin-antitoxin system VapB family antitoxin [Geodermatophilus sp. SYSU D00703]